MCGIYGEYNFGTLKPVVAAEIQAATSTIAHRGPDDEGYFFDGPLGLGFRRLSIIDLAAGHQPMSDGQKHVWVVFNGEIYNFREIRAELESRGHAFRTRSDTEVIVHGYKEWGDGVLDRLNGMFGLAIWDVQQRRLVVARDALGIKPVYYRLNGQVCAFASEMRALVGPEESCELDPVSVNLFLKYRYTPAPRTLYRGIRKLAPGTKLVIDPAGARLSRWYRFEPTPFSERRTVEEATRELLQLYREAVKRHLLSDVPVGLLLSGGIDSALLLALMNEYGKGWHTFTVGFGHSFADDELADAGKTAAAFASRHVSVDMVRADFERYLSRVVTSLEEPVAASSIVPMYVVCERARQDVKVALIGQGPDELFGGYARHLGVRYGEMWRTTPAVIRGAVSRAIAALPRNEALKRGVYALDVADRFTRYQRVFSILPAETIDGLFRPDVLSGDEVDDALFDCWKDLRTATSGADELGAFQWLELQSSLPDELLMYGDKMSMAHGLELRVPYLDRTVVEYAQRLDASLKIRRGTRKYIHRAVCSELLPHEIIGRKKRGFAANVVDQWFRGAFTGTMDGVLLDANSLMYEFLEPTAVRRLVRDHRNGGSNNYKILFSLVVLEQWLRGSHVGSAAALAH
jgi:asparagine synthase (glutamine-hydrolysing)